MNKNFVITIGRQYGSGGRRIGLLLSEMFSIGFYDRKLIAEAGRRSGIHSEFFEEGDEKKPDLWQQFFNFGFGLAPGFSPGFGKEELFKIQSDAIRELAAKESCVIVGRCADYVLRDNPMCINVFICADDESRLERVVARHNCTSKEAAETIAKIDKSRAAYYNFYTDKQWGYSPSYHLCVDSGSLGLEGTAEKIRDFVKSVLEMKGVL